MCRTKTGAVVVAREIMLSRYCTGYSLAVKGEEVGALVLVIEHTNR